MQNLEIGVILRTRNPSENPHNPGHMMVFWVGNNGTEARGFVFSVVDLPQQYIEESRWRDFLFENKVPGYIERDPNAVEDLKNPTLPQHSWRLLKAMTDLVRWTNPRRCGYYSFNPDDFSPRSVVYRILQKLFPIQATNFECHNCVSWATDIANRFAGEVLRKTPNSRVKDMTKQLHELSVQPRLDEAN